MQIRTLQLNAAGKKHLRRRWLAPLLLNYRVRRSKAGITNSSEVDTVDYVLLHLNLVLAQQDNSLLFQGNDTCPPPADN
jgi:hypothetical protein